MADELLKQYLLHQKHKANIHLLNFFEIIVKIKESRGTLKFEWDEEKNTINKIKHKISFETAAYVFNDVNHIEIYDFEHSIDEDRYIAIGCVEKIVFVVFTERKDSIRLISARLATDLERRLYYEQDIYY